MALRMADSDAPRIPAPTVVPRGRHAPPLEVRLTVQRRRLFEAAATVFARLGFAEATAEAISREAGMSKATFYEHFANKEEAILALFDEAATEVMRQMAVAAQNDAGDYPEHLAQGTRAFLRTLAEWPDAAQTLLVEIIGAGPRATERRDAILEAFAEAIYVDNEKVAPRYGAPRFASRDDAFACVGAIVELASRQLRTGTPDDIRKLEPIIERLMLGILQQAAEDLA
jgi:AcrR family transcriptional regulator